LFNSHLRPTRAAFAFYLHRCGPNVPHNGESRIDSSDIAAHTAMTPRLCHSLSPAPCPALDGFSQAEMLLPRICHTRA
jgi:hypothetical protein